MKKYIVCLAMSLMGTSVYADFINKSDKPIVIKLSHVVGANAPKGLASEEFKKIMESKFPGRVKVELYHSNSLFKDSEEVEALELGAVNVIIPTTGKTATSYGVKEFELFDLPFLFNDTNSVLKRIDINFAKSEKGGAWSDLGASVGRMAARLKVIKHGDYYDVKLLGFDRSNYEYKEDASDIKDKWIRWANNFFYDLQQQGLNCG